MELLKDLVLCRFLYYLANYKRILWVFGTLNPNNISEITYENPASASKAFMQTITTEMTAVYLLVSCTFPNEITVYSLILGLSLSGFRTKTFKIGVRSLDRLSQ